MHPDGRPGDMEPAVIGDPSPARAPGDDGPRWSLGETALVYLASVVLSGLVGGLWIAITGRDDLTLGLTVVTLVASWAGLVGGTVLASRRRGTGRLSQDLGLRLEGRDVLPGVAAGVLSQLVILPLLYLPVRLFTHDLDLSEEARKVTGLGSGPGLVLLSLCIVIGAPLAEEIFFRGLLQRTLARRFGATWAVAGSALIFGVTHFQPLLLPGLTAFGVVLAVLTRRSGRLGPALVAHMAFNAVTILALTA
ncbi:MAG: lysostaphin resistance A-like protein [Acidimicrobiales bacterium]